VKFFLYIFLFIYSYSKLNKTQHGVLNVFLFFQSFYLQEETFFSLELALDLPLVFDDLSPTLKKQQLHHTPFSDHFTVMDRLLRSPTGRFYGVLKIEVFKGRSTPLHQTPAATRPSSSIIGVPATRRLALCPIPTSTRQERVPHAPACGSHSLMSGTHALCSTPSTTSPTAVDVF
jgi:hypothetical protein